MNKFLIVPLMLVFSFTALQAKPICIESQKLRDYGAILDRFLKMAENDLNSTDSDGITSKYRGFSKTLYSTRPDLVAKLGLIDSQAIGTLYLLTANRSTKDVFLQDFKVQSCKGIRPAYAQKLIQLAPAPAHQVNESRGIGDKALYFFTTKLLGGFDYE